jgi:TRAP-type C4-dicarboxylate transport system permease small subunit
MSSSAQFEPGHVPDDVTPDAGWVETGAEWLCGLALLVMIVLIGTEAIMRNVFGSSMQIVDEVCGYLLIAVTFLSMSVSEAHRSFHRVELFLSRVSRSARQKLMIAFDFVSLAACMVLTWQLTRLAMNSWRSEDVAPTPLQTPLWLPQVAMGLGTLFLCVALLRTLRARFRMLRRTAP